MTGTEWITKEEKIQQDFLWALGPEATHQITRFEDRTEQYKIRQINQITQQKLFTKRNNNNSRGDFWAKQTDKETPEDHWEKASEFIDSSTELLISKFKTSIADRKLRNKLLNEKDWNVPDIAKQIQQNTYDRKNRKNTIPDAVKTNRKNEIKLEPTHKVIYTGKYEKDRKNKIVDTAKHQIGIATTNAQPQNQYVILKNRELCKSL